MFYMLRMWQVLSLTCALIVLQKNVIWLWCLHELLEGHSVHIPVYKLENIAEFPNDTPTLHSSCQPKTFIISISLKTSSISPATPSFQNSFLLVSILFRRYKFFPGCLLWKVFTHLQRLIQNRHLVRSQRSNLGRAVSESESTLSR